MVPAGNKRVFGSDLKPLYNVAWMIRSYSTSNRHVFEAENIDR
jgi:hypothetical protein